jgi:7,8-dihydropterin-6-yl-methyl-4-(beta-D-ribofuranosyl)aminobenzene 5'-phosphate synthase
VPSEAALTAHGGQVIATRDAQAIVDNTVYVSGEIPSRSGFEVGMPGQHRRTLDNRPGVKLHAVLGGLHLSGINERIIPQTVAALVISASTSSWPVTAPGGAPCRCWPTPSATVNSFPWRWASERDSDRKRC